MEIITFDTHLQLSAIISPYKYAQQHSSEGCLFSLEKKTLVSSVVSSLAASVFLQPHTHTHTHTHTHLTCSFRRFSAHMWQNIHANTARHLMVCKTSDCAHIHKIFKKSETNVVIFHLLTCSNIYNL